MTATADSGVVDEGLEQAVLRRALTSPRFASLLKEDPHGSIEREFGVKLSPEYSIRVVEQQAQEVVLVVPEFASAARSDVTADVAAFAGTNISADSGCHQCCKPR